MVASAQLKTNVTLHHIESSSSNIFYESELFPAALIRKWFPVHIALFHNGYCVLTGLKSFDQAECIVNDLENYLGKCNLLNT